MPQMNPTTSTCEERHSLQVTSNSSQLLDVPTAENSMHRINSSTLSHEQYHSSKFAIYDAQPSAALATESHPQSSVDPIAVNSIIQIRTATPTTKEHQSLKVAINGTQISVATVTETSMLQTNPSTQSSEKYHSLQVAIEDSQSSVPPAAPATESPMLQINPSSPSSEECHRLQVNNSSSQTSISAGKINPIIPIKTAAPSTEERQCTSCYKRLSTINCSCHRKINASN